MTSERGTPIAAEGGALCLGGSFNPIHNGHILCAAAAARAGGYARVVLIPSAQPPHKPQSADLASPHHRLAMAALAAQHQNEKDPVIRFDVDDLELSRNGPSYTIDTARELKSRGWREVNWLIGADMVNYLPKWHDVPALLRDVNFVILARPGHQFAWSSLPAEIQTLRRNVVSSAPLIDISATEVRRRVRGGESIADLVPPPVARYIQAHGLYLR